MPILWSRVVGHTGWAARTHSMFGGAMLGDTETSQQALYGESALVTHLLTQYRGYVSVLLLLHSYVMNLC